MQSYMCSSFVITRTTYIRARERWRGGNIEGNEREREKERLNREGNERGDVRRGREEARHRLQEIERERYRE